MRRLRQVAFAIAALTLCVPARAEPITIDASPIRAFDAADPERSKFGRLEFLGGLVLRSSASQFGGFSGLRISDTGRLRAITDRGYVLTGDMIDEGGGRPVRIEGADLSPIPATNGRTMPETRDFDTEALEIAGSQAWIATERTHRLFRFDVDGDGALSDPRPVALPKATAQLRRNAGIEAIARIPELHADAGALLLVAEAGRTDTADHPAWVVGGKGKGYALSIANRDGFAVTDLVALPGDQHFAMLERRYRPPFSLAVRVRLIAAADLRAGAVVDGEVLIEASLAQEIDNLEGIAAGRAADGRTVLTLISDDNFNTLQRTILLRFALRD